MEEETLSFAFESANTDALTAPAKKAIATAIKNPNLCMTNLQYECAPLD